MQIRWSNMALSLFLTCLISSLPVVVTGNVCEESATHLLNLDMRSVAFDSGLQDESIDLLQDTALGNKWYSTADERNNDLQYILADSTETVDVLSCGTYYPVRLDGPHPLLDDEEETTVYVCAVDFSSHCADTWSIKIRKCNGYFEYKLRSTRSNMAYCFNHERANDPNFQPPAFNVLTDVEVVTAMNYTVIDLRDNQDHADPYLTFSCNTKTEDQYYYRVYWYVNNEPLLSHGPVSGESLGETDLREKNLIDVGYTLGITIKCGVTAANSETGLSTQQKFSDGFFAGMKVHYSASKLSLRKGEVGFVILENTVPLGCPQLVKRVPDNCDVEIEMFDPTTMNDCDSTGLAALNGDNQRTCGVGISPSFYYEERKDPDLEIQFSNTTLKIITTSDAQYDESNTFTLQLRTYAGHTIWDNYKIADITVLINDSQAWKGGVCSSHYDPHVTTADGVPLENQNEGTFVLYRNKKYPIEVQETTKKCSSSAFCPCAVIVRAGADLFEFNICNGIVRYEFLQCDDNILDVRESEDMFTIRTPIGTTIDIQVEDWHGGRYLNIDIAMSPKDFENVEGLCGYYNNDPSDDLKHYHPNGGGGHTTVPKALQNCAPKCVDFDRIYPNEFSDSWRVSTNSEDNPDYSKPENQNQTPWSANQILCVCERSVNETGSAERTEAFCSASEFIICNNAASSRISGRKKECAIKRRKRSIRSIQKERKVRDQRERATFHTSGKRSTDHSNFTIADGINMCRSFLERQEMYTKYKSNLPETGAEATFMADCATDYKLVGPDQSVMEAHFKVFKSRNVNEIKKNKTLEGEGLAVLTEFLIAVSCSGNCSGNGECTEDGCICNDGFGGSFCSVDISDPLDVTYVEGNGTCDLESESCDSHNVQANAILPSPMCRIKETQISAGGLVKNARFYDTPGERNTMYDGYCDTHPPAERKRRAAASGDEIPFVIKYEISISNDGVSYGTPGIVYVFDSQCQDYSSTSTGEPVFSLKTGHCYIDGQCLAGGSVQIADSCYSCNPETNAYNWTMSCTSAPQPDSNIAIVIGASVAAGVVLMVLIASLACFLVKRINRRKCVSSPDVRTNGREQPAKEEHYRLSDQGSSANVKMAPQAADTAQSTVFFNFITDYQRKPRLAPIVKCDHNN